MYDIEVMVATSWFVYSIQARLN